MPSIAGGVIDIEYGTYDSTADAWNYTLVGQTQGEVTWEQDTTVAEGRAHDREIMDRSPATVAPSITFSERVETTGGALDTLGMRDTNDNVRPYLDLVSGEERIRVTVYESQSEKTAGNYQKQIIAEGGHIRQESGSLDPEEFASAEWMVASGELLKISDAGSI